MLFKTLSRFQYFRFTLFHWMSNLLYSSCNLFNFNLYWDSMNLLFRISCIKNTALSDKDPVSDIYNSLSIDSIYSNFSMILSLSRTCSSPFIYHSAGPFIGLLPNCLLCLIYLKSTLWLNSSPYSCWVPSYDSSIPSSVVYYLIISSISTFQSFIDSGLEILLRIFC